MRTRGARALVTHGQEEQIKIGDEEIKSWRWRNEVNAGWRNKVWGVKECWSNEFWTDSQLVWNEDVRSSSNTPSRVKSKVNSSKEEEIQIKKKRWNKDERNIKI